MNHKNDTFDSNGFTCNSKDISDGKSNLCHQKCYLPSTKVLGFVYCRVTSKIPGVGSADRSWGDYEKIKSVKISSLSSDISKKQTILYESDCIE